MKKRIIVINRLQFGYEIDTYYYCKYLRNHFDLTYICWDYGKKKISMEDIDVKYISRRGNIFIRNIRFIKNIIIEINKNNYNVHIIKYFRGCSILKIIYPSKKFIFDIRTGAVSKKRINRFLFDNFMKFESKFFKNITVISKSLRLKLKLSEKKTYILPLGADIISKKNKQFNCIKLLYIGTLHNRNMEKTITGFEKFYLQLKNKIKIKYMIIGEGYNNESYQLREIVKGEKLNNIVNIAGYIQHDDAKKYFNTHNIGVSFIPKTDFFDVQPPTKTFEYLLSGMPVIATSTLENQKVINKDNGVLIDDTPEGFYNGLMEIYNKLNHYNSNKIRINSSQYKWEKIIDKFKAHIESII